MRPRIPFLRAARRPAFMTALLLLTAGCGSKTAVSGKVTFKGTPLTGGSVTLVASDGTAHSGNINPDGTYSIPDVPTGTVQVGVAGPGPAGAGRAGPGGRGGDGKAVGRKAPGDEPPPPPKPAAPPGPAIPDTYLDPKTSGVTGVVKPGEPLNIDLK